MGFENQWRAGFAVLQLNEGAVAIGGLREGVYSRSGIKPSGCFRPEALAQPCGSSGLLRSVSDGKKLDSVGVGLTLGYSINENLNLTVGYKSTLDDSAPTDLRMDSLMVSLVFGWHPLIEGSRRLKSGK
jgi:hypothetical protein